MMGAKKQKTVSELKAEMAKIEERIREVEKAEKEKIGAWIQSITGLNELADIKANYTVKKLDNNANLN